MTSRYPLVLAAAVAAFLVILGPAPAAVAEPDGGSCRTFTTRVFLGSGDVRIRIGWVDAAFQYCTDGDGRVTRASATQSTGTTSPGTLAGFSIDPGQAVIVYQDAFRVRAEYRGRTRVCFAQRTPVCSRSDEYVIYAHIPVVGPVLNHPEGAPQWQLGSASDGITYYRTA